jgi:hypothetical protein
MIYEIVGDYNIWCGIVSLGPQLRPEPNQMLGMCDSAMYTAVVMQQLL